MADITATLAPSDEIVITKFAELPANFTLSQLTDTTITSPSDGSFLVYDNSSTRWIDDQTIVKTSTGITLTGSLAVTTDIDVDGTLEADAITVNGIQLSEVISDTVGTMIADGTNTESGISVTYEDSDNTLDFNVDDFSITLTGDVTGSGTVTNLGNVSFATTIQAGSLENDMLAGSIANAKLSNSTVSYGGISLALGANDDTPAFNLQDATGYPTSSLVGTITNAQLSNSTVNFGGVSVALGASDTTPAFDLQHATNLPATSLTGDMPNARIVVGNVTQHQAALSVATSQLSGTISNSQLDGSITNDKLSNSSITVSDGSNTSPVALGGTLTFAGTSNEVTVAESSGTVTIGLPDDIAISGELEGGSLDINGNADISGNLTLSGGSGIIATQTLNVNTVNAVGVLSTGIVRGGSLDINGNADISGNLVLDGNLTVSGTTTTVNTSTLTVEDPLIKLASGNASGDTVDIGLYGLYDNTGSQDVYSGIFRDATDDKWKLFKSLEIEPTATVNTSGAGYAVDTLVANLEGNVTGTLQTAAQTNITSLGTLTGLTLGATSATVGGKILFTEGTDGGTNAVSLIGPATTADVDILLPNVAGTIVLKDSTDILTNKSIVATQLTGTIDNARLPSAATNIKSVGTLTNLVIQPPVGSTGGILVNSEGGSASFLLAGVGSVGDADYVAPGNFYVLGAAAAYITSAAITLVGTTAVNGALTVNNNLFEIVSTDADADSDPTLSLYRNRASVADDDDIGKIKFYGNNDADTPEKIEYAGIYAEITDMTDGTEDGELNFYAIAGGVMEDPVMRLDKDGLELLANNDLIFGINSLISFQGDTAHATNKTTLYATDPTAARAVLLPDASGTVALTTSNVSSATLASTVTVTDSTANTDFPVVFHNESNGLLDDTGALTYNPSTGALVSSGTISAYVSTAEAAQLRAGREDGQDISIFCSDTINSIVADQDTDANADQQFVLNRTFNGNAAQSSNNSYFKIQNNGSTELEIKGGWNDNSVSETTLNTTLTTGATTINGELTVNSNTLKLTSTTASSTTENPSIELFRNGGSAAAGAELGAIKFFGTNNASTPEKIEYAGIYAETEYHVDGSEQGNIKFKLSHGGAQEDPVMSLFSYGMKMGYGNPILMSYSNGYQQFFSENAVQKSFKFQAFPNATVANGAYNIYLPDVAGGTLAVIDSDKAFTAGATTVNGALTVSSGITGSQTLAPTTDTSISVSEFAAFAGKKIIYTGGAGTIALPAAVAADNGKSWVIINAGTGTLTIDVDGSSTAQYVRFLTGGAVTTSNSANRIIAAGGSAELVCIADGSATNSATVPNYLIYGGGIS